jgi:hypothetical protein
MSLLQDNSDFEKWLRKQCDVVEGDLEKKHERMGQNPFRFLRATYFRWARKIEKLLPDLNDAPKVLSVGDAHLENFGTWRDAEGRLVWGINDFDDAAVMPYPLDLVRLCTSASLSPDLKIDGDDAAAAILDGYVRGLKKPAPALLDGNASWLRPFVVPSELVREKFKNEFAPNPKTRLPAGVKKGFLAAFPGDAEIIGYAKRSKGGGSLGRPRFVAIAKWRGGQILREAKGLVASGWDWAHDKEGGDIKFLNLARSAYRAPDPFLDIHEKFIFRRIAADSRKLDFGGEVPERLEAIFLEAMGRDIASIHMADRRGSKIEDDLKERPKNWLHEATIKAKTFVKKDYDGWISAHPDLAKFED